MTRVEKNISILLFLFLFIVLWVNLGNQPLYMEEPRRALIALEMWLSHNYLVPTQFGEIYTSKPPLYNWLLLGLFRLCCTTNEWLVRLPTVFSLLGVFFLTYHVGKKYVGIKFAVYAAFFFVISADLLIVFSLLGEIDVFYSLITVSSLFSIFHFFQQKQFWKLFLWSYFFAALGFLTKGVPSIAYVGISLTVYFIYQKELKQLFSLKHLAGIFLFLFIVGTYFLMYHQQADAKKYLLDLVGEASKKSTLGGFPLLRYLKHLVLFPIQTVGALFPTSLLILFLNKVSVKRILKQNPLLGFSAIIVLSNIILYWISPGSKQRYIYPLYPFISIFLVYFFLENVQEKNRKRFELCVFLILCGMLVFSLLLPAVQVYEPSKELAHIQYIAVYGIAFAIVFGALLYFYFKKYKAFVLIAAMLACRLLVDLVIVPSRNSLQNKAKDEQLSAQKIAEIVGDKQLHVFWAWPSQRTGFYYTQAAWRGISYINEQEFMQRQEGYCIIRSKAPAHYFDRKHQVCLAFESNNHIEMKLIKFLPPEGN